MCWFIVHKHVVCFYPLHLGEKCMMTMTNYCNWFKNTFIQLIAMFTFIFNDGTFHSLVCWCLFMQKLKNRKRQVKELHKFNSLSSVTLNLYLSRLGRLPSQGHTFTLVATSNLELTWLHIFELWKRQCPERSHTGAGRTCKLLTERNLADPGTWTQVLLAVRWQWTQVLLAVRWQC